LRFVFALALRPVFAFVFTLGLAFALCPVVAFTFGCSVVVLPVLVSLVLRSSISRLSRFELATALAFALAFALALPFWFAFVFLLLFLLCFGRLALAFSFVFAFWFVFSFLLVAAPPVFLFSSFDAMLTEDSPSF